MRITLILIIAAATLTTGCTDYYAQVESNTSWSGAFGNRTVEGHGDQKVDLPDDSPQCVVVQKQTESGTLSVQVKNDENFILGGSDGEKATTTASYGVVSSCSGN